MEIQVRNNKWKVNTDMETSKIFQVLQRNKIDIRATVNNNKF